MAEQTGSVPFIPPELRRHIASYCDRATLVSLCKVDVRWSAESMLLLLASLVLRVFYKEDATNAVDACLDALCESELKAASVTTLAIYYPVDDSRARELLWRTYGVIPRLRNLVDLRLHTGSKDQDAVRGLYAIMWYPRFRDTVRLRTLVIPHAAVSGLELALLRSALRAQPALELCVVRYHAYDVLNQPGVLPPACVVVAYEGQVHPSEGHKLTVDRLTPATADRLWRVFEDNGCDSEYPWETVPIPLPLGVRAQPDDDGFHIVDGSSDVDEMQEGLSDDPDRERVGHTVPRRTVGDHLQLAAGGVSDFPTVRRRPQARPVMQTRHRPRVWTLSDLSFRSQLLAGRMRHPNRLDVDTVELLLDEVPHADVMRQVQDVCPNAHTISLAFRTRDELAHTLTPSAIATAVRPCRTILRILNLKVLRGDGLGIRGPAITDPREFLQAVLDVGCYEIQKITFWQRAECTKCPSSGLWQTVTFS